MKRNSTTPAETARKRCKAEERLWDSAVEDGAARTETSAQRLLHELQVHQIELEMQNEELRQAKNDLEAAVEKYNDLYDFAPVSYLTLDWDGRIRTLNFIGADLLGKDRALLIGCCLREFISSKDRPLFTAFLDSVFTGQGKKTCELTLLNTGKHPLIVQVEALGVESGQECRIALFDITERKLTEDKLRKKERQSDEMQSLVHLGNWQWDSIGNVVTGSDEFYRIFGVAFDSYNVFLERVHPDDRAMVIKSVQDTFDRQLPYDIYCRIVLPDETIRFIHALGRARTDETGKVVRMIGTAQDVTERRAIEDELSEYRRKLEELNRSLESQIENALDELRKKDQILILQDRLVVMGEMINNISHQWRQPLNTLGMVIQQLPLFYGMEEFNREFLEKNTAEAMKQIQYMAQTIDDFRNFFMPDKIKVVFDVAQVIGSTLSLIEKSFQDLRIHITLHSEGKPRINGHPNEYAQVLLNILTNARDALVEHSIDNALISIRVFSEGDAAVVTITDNAGGIREEVMGRIFDSYFTTKGPDKGTGIGLYMSKGIIEKKMGGRLTVRNVPSGAEFRIEV